MHHPYKPLQDSDFRTMSNGEEVALNPGYYGGMFTLRHRDENGEVSGYTCLGYDVCNERILRYAKWLGEQVGNPRPLVDPSQLPPRGSFESYEMYLAMLVAMRGYCNGRGIRCTADLNPQLLPYEGQQVEVVDKFGERRRFKVGRSTGWLPCLLEVEKGEVGGMAISATDVYQSVTVLKKGGAR